MIALDSFSLLGPRLPRIKVTLGPLVGGIASIAAVLVLGSILLRGFSGNGFRLGSQLAWRYTCLVFFTALVSGPLCRLTAHFLPAWTAPETLGRKLIWGFAASYGIYLLSVFLPNVIELSAGASLMTLFGSLVVLVMAACAAPIKRLGGKTILPEKIRRVLLGIALAYFWLCYVVMALARISAPYLPDAFYIISLCLMIAGLLVRYAERWISGKEPPRPSKIAAAG
jgi:hypothetical protein